MARDGERRFVQVRQTWTERGRVVLGATIARKCGDGFKIKNYRDISLDSFLRLAALPLNWRPALNAVLHLMVAGEDFEREPVDLRCLRSVWERHQARFACGEGDGSVDRESMSDRLGGGL